MSRVKDIKIKVIPSNIANEFIKIWHYSGKVVNNSQVHFGAFLDGELHGVMSFGCPLDKSKVLGLVKDTKWNDMLELNRMAFDDKLPKNSESRCISVAIKLIKKNAPNIKWILSFADGTQCGDGTIYRASGFVLTMIKENSDLYKTKDCKSIHSMSIKSSKTLLNKYGNWKKALYGKYGNVEKFIGYQLRYIYLIDKKAELNCEIIPFSKINEMGAGMYKGKKRCEGSVNNSTADVQSVSGGVSPTSSLHISEALCQ